MPLSCLLAVMMLIDGRSAGAFLLAQDAPAAAQASRPPSADPVQPPPSKNETPAEGPNTPDQAGKPADSKKSAESKEPVRANRRRGKHDKQTEGTQTSPDEGPSKIVVRHGGVKEPTAQIMPNLPPAEAIKQRQNAEGLLGSAEVSLRVLEARILQPQEEEAVAQVRNYMGKARSALRDGDIQRGHTLALKANLLAADLVRH